jgi:hypothetical protein
MGWATMGWPAAVMAAVALAVLAAGGEGLDVPAAMAAVARAMVVVAKATARAEALRASG